MTDDFFLSRITGRAVAPLTAVHWTWAMALGHARTASNDAVRSKEADRGDLKNAAADLLGALGEIYLLKKFHEDDPAGEAVSYIRRHLFIPEGGGGVKGPDVSWVSNGKSLSIDVKTFDCAPNKRFAAINAAKHKSLEGCTGYVFAIAPLFATRLLVSHVVPYEHVDQWETRDLGRRGAPSKNLEFSMFWTRYGVGSVELARSAWRTLVFDEIATAIMDGLSYRPLFELAPELCAAKIEGKPLDGAHARAILLRRLRATFGAQLTGAR